MSEVREKILAKQPLHNGSYEDNMLNETQMVLNHIEHGQKPFSAINFMKFCGKKKKEMLKNV